MKKKDLKKISKYLFDSIEKKNSPKKNMDYSMEKDPGYKWCEYDASVSSKLTKLFNGLMNYTGNLEVEFSETWIHIQTDNIKKIKQSSNSGQLTKLSEDDYLKIEITKGVGFLLNYGYRKITRYKDENIFDQLIDDVKRKVQEINANNFDSIWEKINKESGLLRDSNLDEIFSEK